MGALALCLKCVFGCSVGTCLYKAHHHCCTGYLISTIKTDKVMRKKEKLQTIIHQKRLEIDKNRV